MFDEPAAVQGESATEKKDPVKDMSAKMRDSITYSVVTGMMHSIAAFLVGSLSDKSEAEKKLKVVANALVAGGDIPHVEVDWMTSNYIREIQRIDAYANMPTCTDSYSSWYMALSALFDEDSVRTKWFDTNQQGYTEEEVEIINEYNAAMSAMYKARDRFVNYVANLNKFVLNQMLLKYGTTLQQTVPEWYKRVLSCAGVAAKPDEPEAAS